MLDLVALPARLAPETTNGTIAVAWALDFEFPQQP